jgi:hypothetical protein
MGPAQFFLSSRIFIYPDFFFVFNMSAVLNLAYFVVEFGAFDELKSLYSPIVCNCVNYRAI